MSEIKFAVLGQYFHCPIKGDFEYAQQALIQVDNNGTIVSVMTEADADFHTQVSFFSSKNQLIELSSSQYLMPGMVDLHVHAPQFPQAGKGLDLPLYDWLQDYTFPLEAKFADMDFTKQIYPSLVKSLLANGTTSAVYFATIHKDSSVELARECLKQGQRGFVGKVNMDEASQCPPFYIEHSTADALKETEQFVQEVIGLEGNEQQLVSPVLTPRFVPSCTSEMLQGLGELAQKYQCHVQTHCSESDWARDYSQQMYGKTDAEIYRDFGLMTNRTILAHSIFLTPADHAIIKETGASIAHCPLSNMYFANAAMQSREILDNGLKCGLGSDLAGAPIPSIFHTCLDAVNHSRVREDGTSTYLPADTRGESGSRISFLESYWMATVGGGQAIDAKVGLFQPGFEFDALVVDTAVSDSNIFIIDEMDSAKDKLEKIITLNNRQNICKVWVKGQLVINK
ncbi:guanine deaminase [Shewanella pneumatophori]|uniref:Guanine deaminase n=1 Tax=Shewanella pneumatophori TaxID=314092 RepID=A0A9X1ZEF2_9GAMM|nr:guanine deaminase [Shewanella pneumatophori]MCL1137890.1 guanine deaminase [Shewanella pneumatophori]